MSTNELRSIINRINAIKIASGERDVKISEQARLMFVVNRINSTYVKSPIPSVGNREVNQWILLIIEILDFHSVHIEIGKHRNTWPVFVKERSEWSEKKIKDVPMLFFTITQKICAIPGFYFKTELIGQALGMIYGYLDQQGIETEALIDVELSKLEKTHNLLCADNQ